MLLSITAKAQHADLNKQQQQMQQTAVAMAGISVGKPAPNFTFADANGKKYSLSDFLGKVVYLDAWASWCGPCRQQIPAAKTLEEKYKDKAVVFLAVSIDANEAAWRKCLTDFTPAGIQLLAKGDNGKFATEYNLTTIPRYILIDKKGNIASADAKRPSMGVEPDIDFLLK